MNKLFAFIMTLILATPVWADILLSPQEEAVAKQRMEEGQENCPPDKPLFDGEKCHSCDEQADIRVANSYSRCSAICPNRYEKHIHIPRVVPGLCVHTPDGTDICTESKTLHGDYCFLKITKTNK